MLNVNFLEFKFLGFFFYLVNCDYNLVLLRNMFYLSFEIYVLIKKIYQINSLLNNEYFFMFDVNFLCFQVYFLSFNVV